MNKDRPVGVKVFSMMQVISGIIGFLCFFILGISAVFFTPYDPAKGPGIYKALGLWSIGAGFLYLLLFFLGIMLFKLKPLARKLTIILSPLYYGLICLLLAIPLDRFFKGVGLYIFAIWLFLVTATIRYFTRPKVKEQFK